VFVFSIVPDVEALIDDVSEEVDVVVVVVDVTEVVIAEDWDKSALGDEPSFSIFIVLDTVHKPSLPLFASLTETIILYSPGLLHEWEAELLLVH